jgi:hypothetical protein
MKGLLFVCFLLIFLGGCKKSNETLSPIEVQVTGLQASSGLTVLAFDVTQHNAGILNVNLAEPNVNCSTAIVYPGDQISITYSFPPPNAGTNGIGEATINYYYKGQKLGGTSGALNYPTGFSTSLTVPAL